MGPTKRLIVVAGLIAGASLIFVPAALAQVGNTDRAHLQCAQGGGNGPVFGAHSAGDVGGIAALTDPSADHGAAGVLANNSNAAGPGEGGSSGGLGGSSLRGGGAGGCPGPTLPTTGAPIGRLALWGVSLFVLGVPLLLIARQHAWNAAAVGRRIATYSLDSRMGRRLRYLEIRELHQARRRS